MQPIPSPPLPPTPQKTAHIHNHLRSIVKQNKEKGYHKESNRSQSKNNNTKRFKEFNA